MSFGPLSPFDLSLVLMEIGTLLGRSDLCACALVNRHWHSHFAPFVYWLELEKCNAIARRLYDINIARPLKVGRFAQVKPEKSFDPNYRLLADYLAHMDALVERIKRPSSSPAFHRRIPRALLSLSYLSFTLLGTLSDNVRKINFTFVTPQPFADPGDEIDPDVYAFSAKEPIQERPDRVMEVIERSGRLEHLALSDYCGSTIRIFRWIHSANPGQWRDMQLPLSAPRWPNLKLVELRVCTLDEFFLRTLFVNSPGLKILRLTEVSIRSTSGVDENLGFMNPHPDAHPILEELLIARPKLFPAWMQVDLARIQPNLKTFQLCWETTSEPPLLFARGFNALTTLGVYFDSPYSIAPVVQAASRLESMCIKGKLLLDEALCLAFKRHSWTLTTLMIVTDTELRPATMFAPGSRNHAVDPLHLILRTCHALKFCTVLSPVLKCDPTAFDQPWACNEIEKLIIIPDCEPKAVVPLIGQSSSASYTPLEAQHAFYRQLARLKSLQILGFYGNVGSRSFHAERYLELLCDLDQLEVLKWHARDLDSSAQPTIEHAVLVVNHWPRLKAIRGLYHYVCRPFVDHVKAHRPDLDLRF
ncbi:hypothetical protein BGZ70_001017 [Mortierella alpina]|uniref:F-box domain-containing protein n=1 Tax=Mortierella alpina TaxID=64518 RepID=A0A9P6M5Y0_MORAP|nr:hypothetical protein BGZ70_001017 [Mortierella alpina]